MPGPWDTPPNDWRRRLGDDLDELERINPAQRPLTVEEIATLLFWFAVVMTPFMLVWLVHLPR
jgi:hypothetical protein